MSGTSNSPLPLVADAQTEIARALRLSANLNNPDDHAVVAQYIAELEVAALRRVRDSRQTL